MAWEVVVKFGDDFNGETQKTYELDSADYTAATVDAADVVAKAQAATDLQVLQYRLCEVVVYAGTLVSGANIDRGATFTGRKAGDNKKTPHKLPGIKKSFVNSDRSINLTATEVNAYLALFQAGGPCYLSDGEKITVWLKGTLDK